MGLLGGMLLPALSPSGKFPRMTARDQILSLQLDALTRCMLWVILLGLIIAVIGYAMPKAGDNRGTVSQRHDEESR